MVVPDGFVLPPWYFFVPLVLLLAVVVALLWVLEPPVTDRTVVAFAPWMMLGSTFHVLYRLEAWPEPIAALFSSPTVYLTTALIAGVVWLLGSFVYAAGLQPSIERLVGVVGTGFFAVFAAVTIAHGWEVGTFSPLWPVLSVVITGIVTALAWLVLSLTYTQAVATTGMTGALVVFSQALDGVSTAVGYDVIGVHEEVPASRFILETGEALPTYEYLGAGWLFVVVKVLLALVVVGLFTDFVREAPRRGRIVLAFIAAVGLGPGVHNVLLFIAT
ncbi:DUF63 family protein [Natrialbaceae archaeon AArc-T1-2]|uniref:DUF63 family protein n=1 Tax=Natrialbaceae archaeon AArc-T1-2 TaxID=3053904 RepID=UPI00255AE7C7|nr:DUF63 family protein [Natrialbaceae archaeon AArc-T1-2]WIV67811.1 DUF63 family protein [Natrialbaceae archaeon AArc-T1-2]